MCREFKIHPSSMGQTCVEMTLGHTLIETIRISSFSWNKFSAAFSLSILYQHFRPLSAVFTEYWALLQYFNPFSHLVKTSMCKYICNSI